MILITNNSNTNDTHTDTNPINNNAIMMIMANTSLYVIGGFSMDVYYPMYNT